MSDKISNELLCRLNEFVYSHLGLDFPKERFDDLERGFAAVAREFGFKDIESCFGWLKSEPFTREQIEIIASYLTIGETYFFRDMKNFELLRKQIIPKLIKERSLSSRRLRIWSTGCATGEEPYSIAIILKEKIPDISEWNITILATDINAKFLKQASEGKYRQWSFRSTPTDIKHKYFKEAGDGFFELDISLRRMIKFNYHNLVEDNYPSLLNDTNAMDIIFCKNVLIYFAREQAQKTVSKLANCLVENGILIVAPTETTFVSAPLLKRETLADVTFFKKFLTEPEPKMPVVPIQKPEEKVVPSPKLAVVKPEEISDTAKWYKEVQDLYKQGQYEEALAKAIRLSSEEAADVKLSLLITRILANQGKLQEALQWCEKAIEQEKFNPVSRYLYATILEEQGEIDKAVKSLKQALYLNPLFVLAHFSLGSIMKRLGKSSEAEKHLNNTLNLLGKYDEEDIIPYSEGITAKRLKEIIVAMKAKNEAR